MDVHGLAVLALRLKLSGILAAAILLTIPISAAVAGGAVVGEIASAVWYATLIPVALQAWRVLGSKGGGTIALVIGLVGMLGTIAGILAPVAGLTSSMGSAPLTILASALAGVWILATSLRLVAAQLTPSSVGRLGAIAGAAPVVAWVLLTVGGLPPSADPAAMSSMGPLTIIGAMASFLSIPLYAGWAIWAARRMARPV